MESEYREEYTTIGRGTKIYNPELSNIGHCKIGENCVIHSHCWIGDGVIIGNRVKIQAFTFIPDGVTIEDDVFIGPRTTFLNDKNPPSGRANWLKTLVKRGAVIGANATILPGIEIGENTTIGAGSVVTKSMPSNVVACGNPARIHAGKTPK